MRAMPDRMSRGDPAYESAKFTIFSWAQHQVPVGGHQLIAVKSHFVALQPLRDDSLERRIIMGVLKQNTAIGTLIQGMVESTRFVRARGGRDMDLTLLMCSRVVNKFRTRKQYRHAAEAIESLESETGIGLGCDRVTTFHERAS